CEPVTIGEAERLVRLDVVSDPLQSAAGERLHAGVHDRDGPGLWFSAPKVDTVSAEIERHVRGMEQIVGEVLLDGVALVTAADHEVVDAMRGIDLHDVPENGSASDVDHRLGPEMRFLS